MLDLDRRNRPRSALLAKRTGYIEAIDEDALTDMGDLPPKADILSDKGGGVRLVAPRLRFENHLAAAVGQLRGYAAADANAAAKLQDMLKVVKGSIANPAARAAIIGERERVERDMSERTP